MRNPLKRSSQPHTGALVTCDHCHGEKLVSCHKCKGSGQVYVTWQEKPSHPFLFIAVLFWTAIIVAVAYWLLFKS